MKLKTLKKKIRRLEKRLREGPAKLAKLKRNLQTMEANRKIVARARAASGKASKPPRASGKVKLRVLRKAPVKPKSKKSAVAAPAKARRKLNLSPERRAQLSEAMKARWAAKRAAETNPPPPAPPPDYSLGEHPQTSEGWQGGA